MTDNHVDDDDVTEGDVLLFNATVRLRTQLKKARDLVALDVTHFKKNHAYRLKSDRHRILLINDIGPDPISRLPTGYGLFITADGFEPGYAALADLLEGAFR